MRAERRQARARLGSAAAKAKKDPAAQAEVEKARQDYIYTAAEDYVRQLVDTFPPLTDEQRSSLALLLHQGAA